MKSKWIRGAGLVGCAALMVCLFSGVASAGEITGNGKWVAGSEEAPLKGRSACAYSGQQDNPDEAELEGFKGFRTQSWGQLPKATRIFLTLIGMNPGNSCNPTRALPE